MRANCEFNSEVLERAVYTINDKTFTFDKKGCHWKCNMDDLPKLIDLIEESFLLPNDYDVPPINIKYYRRVITIKQGDNQIKLKETLMIKFIKELREVYEVYG